MNRADGSKNSSVSKRPKNRLSFFILGFLFSVKDDAIELQKSSKYFLYYSALETIAIKLINCNGCSIMAKHYSVLCKNVQTKHVAQ